MHCFVCDSFHLKSWITVVLLCISYVEVRLKSTLSKNSIRFRFSIYKFDIISAICFFLMKRRVAAMETS